MIIVNARGTFAAEKSPRADIFIAGFSLELLIPSFEVESSEIKDVADASGLGKGVFGVSEKHDSAETVFKREARFVLIKGLVDDLDFPHEFSVLES